jgi:hypothetical protein
MLCQKQSWLDVDASRPGTPPVAGYVRVYGTYEVPYDFASKVLRFIIQSHPRAAVLAANWSEYPADEPFKSNLVATVLALLKQGVQVYVVKDVPVHGYNVPHFAAIALMHDGNASTLGVTPAQHEQTNRKLEATFDLMAHMGATVLDPAPYFLNKNGLYGVEKDNKVLYIDGDHLSAEGSMLLAPLFEPMFHIK